MGGQSKILIPRKWEFKVDRILMTFLKPKVGLGTVLQDVTKHFSADQRMLGSWDLIYGSLVIVIPPWTRYI